MKKKIIIILTLLVLIIAAVLGYQYQIYQIAIQQPLNITEPGQEYRLKPGTSIRSVSQEMQQMGVISHARYLEWLARENKQAGSIQAGEYFLQPGLTMETLLELFVSGRTIQHKFSIIEGTRYRDALDTVIKLDKLEQNIIPEQFEEAFKQWTGEAHPEGWLYPDTYYYASEDSAKDVLMRAYEKMKAELEKAWENRQPDLPLQSSYEALILASIVEKETAVADERPLIAGVFVNRLRKGMKLQTDPTVIYGMGDRYQGNIRKTDLKKDTPYNTYTRTGLPPTPIALSGKEALQAVVHPAETDALYFVAKGGGRHAFSKTYKEHRKAVIRYQLKGNAKRYRGDE